MDGFYNPPGIFARNFRSKSGERQRDYVKTLAISSCHNVSYSFVNKTNANVFIHLSFELQFKKAIKQRFKEGGRFAQIKYSSGFYHLRSIDA